MARLKYKIDATETKEVETRLGKVKLNLSSAIFFPHGIIGFNNLHYYCLCSIPDNKIADGVLLLQSAEDSKLGFIVLPLAERFYKEKNNLIKYEDIMLAANSYDIKEQNLSVLVIASIKIENSKPQISINLKAPILVDGHEKIAYQHVFVKHDYPLAFELSPDV